MARHPLSRSRALLLAALVLHVLPFAIRPALIGGDERHYALMAHSLAVGHDTDLTDDYAAVEAGSKAAGKKGAGKSIERHLRDVNEHETFQHPLGLPLLAAPFLAVQQAIAPASAPDLLLGLMSLTVTFAALVVGWRLVATLTGSPSQASLVVFGLYFATPVWFYSRTFFTEPYTWAFGVLAVGAIVSGRWALASALLAAALSMKETALLIVAPILVTTALLRGIRSALVLTIGPALFGIAFAIKNVLLVGTPFSTFQAFHWGNPMQGALGLLVDPSRGLVFFAPIALVAMIALAGSMRPAAPRQDLVLLGASAAIFVLYFAVTAAWFDWGGGSCYGPRLLVPALPALAVPLARSRWFAGRPLVRGALFTTTLAGFVVNWCAAVYPVKAFWSAPWWAPVLANPWNGLLGALIGIGVLVYCYSGKSSEGSGRDSGATSPEPT